MSLCSRRGCTKELRKDNAKGVCSSNCQSPHAPIAVQAKDVELIEQKPAATPAEPTEKASEPGAAEKKFRALHDAMGMDPEKTLSDFYTSWLEGIRQALES